jgi:hypothetical protein
LELTGEFNGFSAIADNADHFQERLSVEYTCKAFAKEALVVSYDDANSLFALFTSGSGVGLNIC